MLMFKNKLQVALSFALVLFIVWWATFQSVVADQGTSVSWFEGTYGLFALVGATIGLVAAKKWGGFKAVLGKALTFFSLGLLAQEAGQLIYQYYIYVSKIDIPYPSWGDAAYFGSVILYVVAAIYLLKAVGAKYSLKNITGKLIAFIVPVALLALSFFVFLHNHEYDTSQPLTVFLDFGYPIGQAVYISLAIIAYLLSKKSLGGVLKNGFVLVMVALTIQYIADFSFIYQSSRETYVAGKYVDLIYLISYFTMATALLQFSTIFKGINTPKTPVCL